VVKEEAVDYREPLYVIDDFGLFPGEKGRERDNSHVVVPIESFWRSSTARRPLGENKAHSEGRATQLYKE